MKALLVVIGVFAVVGLVFPFLGLIFYAYTEWVYTVFGGNK